MIKIEVNEIEKAEIKLPVRHEVILCELADIFNNCCYEPEILKEFATAAIPLMINSGKCTDKESLFLLNLQKCLIEFTKEAK